MMINFVAQQRVGFWVRTRDVSRDFGVQACSFLRYTSQRNFDGRARGPCSRVAIS